jgi:dienelactone hydrolase
MISVNAEVRSPVTRSAPLSETVELPVPTGEYQVGTITYHWIDEKREELWTTEPDDHRQLMVQIWYPADKQSRGTKAPYIFDLEKIRPSIEKYWENMPAVHTQAMLNIPISRSEGKYPVLVFSHGMNSGRFLYTSILQELASHGYVVASIDHTYWGPGVAFPDGKIVGFEDGMIARDKLDSNEIDRMMLEGIRVMSADQEFVAEKLRMLDLTSQIFKNKLDLAKTGAIGHSMGGMAATASCLQYTAFKTCVSLDGVNYFLNKMPNPSSKPFLLLLNSEWGKNTPPKIKKSYLEAWENPAIALINGTKHSSYSDIPLIEPFEKKDGLLEPRRAFRIISSYTVSFFDIYLKRTKGKLPKFSAMELIDLKSIEAEEKKEKTN